MPELTSEQNLRLACEWAAMVAEGEGKEAELMTILAAFVARWSGNGNN